MTVFIANEFNLRVVNTLWGHMDGEHPSAELRPDKNQSSMSSAGEGNPSFGLLFLYAQTCSSGVPVQIKYTASNDQYPCKDS